MGSSPTFGSERRKSEQIYLLALGVERRSNAQRVIDELRREAVASPSERKRARGEAKSHLRLRK